MTNYLHIACILLICVLIAGCGASTDTPATTADPQASFGEPDDEPVCAEPTGQQKAALRFAMRDRALLDEPWSLRLCG